MLMIHTTLYCNIDQCVNEYIINEELHKLTEWPGANKLALNISKKNTGSFMAVTEK